jgi:AraC family transcriptional regulator of adaptative response / DNA-3-methyladenine glycosylase II
MCRTVCCQDLSAALPAAPRHTGQERTGARIMTAHRLSEVHMSPTVLELSYTPPYDWRSMLDFLAARAVAGVEQVWDAGYARTFVLQGAQGAFALEPAAGHRVRLTVQVPDAGALPQVVYRVRRMFDLDTDPRPIAAHLRSDPLLGPLVAAHPGLRVPGSWDGFELAVRAVLGQQISVAAATALAGRLAQAHGEALSAPVRGLPVPDGPAACDEQATCKGLTHLFPDATRLEGATISGMPRSRAVTLSSLATAALDDSRLFGPYPGLQEAVTRLRSMSGVGDWTAQYIAMRALREPDAFPATDIVLQRALAVKSARPSPAEVLERARLWRPWRAYAALHLWAAQARAARGIGADTARRAA